MNNTDKKIAFTLAEVLITLMIVAFIAWPFIQAAKRATNHYRNSLGAYSAFMALTSAAYDMATSNGCTLADMAASGGLHPYCPGTTGAANTGYIPWYISTSADAGTPTRGFCDRVVSEEFNAVSSSCSAAPTATDASAFNTLTPAFTASNGMRFFFASGTNPLPSRIATGYYAMYVDIDGLKSNPNVGGVLNQDVLKFFVGLDSVNINADPNGPALPDPNGIAANSTDYLNASIKYNNGTSDVYLATGITYRKAACLADTTANVGPRALIATYCDAQTNYPTAYNSQALVTAVANNCAPTTPGNTCVMELTKPKMMGNSGP